MNQTSEIADAVQDASITELHKAAREIRTLFPLQESVNRPSPGHRYFRPQWTIPVALYERFQARHYKVLMITESLGNAVQDRSEETFFQVILETALNTMDTEEQQAENERRRVLLPSEVPQFGGV